MDLRQLDAVSALAHLDALVVLLQDAVESGASIGFLPPLSDDDARKYWQSVIDVLNFSNRVLLAAFAGDAAIGSVQLDLCSRQNGLHRAEVMKLFVHRDARRRGIATILMDEVERLARENGRTLLVLDTRKGDAAEKLYKAIGYIEAGIIPRYARSANGELDDSVFMYKELNT